METINCRIILGSVKSGLSVESALVEVRSGKRMITGYDGLNDKQRKAIDNLVDPKTGKHEAKYFQDGIVRESYLPELKTKLPKTGEKYETVKRLISEINDECEKAKLSFKAFTYLHGK
jgi:hypothetical protein